MMGVSPTVEDCKEADASTLEFPVTKTPEPCREKDDGRVVKGRTCTSRESSAMFVWPVAKAVESCARGVVRSVVRDSDMDSLLS